MSDKNPISSEVLAQIKAQLLADREQILAELNEIARKDKSETQAKFPEYGDKPDENAQEIEGYTTNLATERILVDNLRDIEQALERIDQGSYGICKYCGLPINEKRLLARPVASACVDCKSKLQNG